MLYEKAKEAVRNDTSFTFKKGKSRSTLSSEIDVEKSAKRKNTTESFRKEHVIKLLEDIDGKKKEIKFKMLHQSKAQNSKDWETCEKLQKEMNTLRQELHKCQQELQLLERKEKKSKWYKKSKKSDDREENSTGGGQKHKSLFQSFIQKTIEEKSTTEESGSGKVTYAQETSVKEKEICSHTQTADNVGQGFLQSPL